MATPRLRHTRSAFRNLRRQPSVPVQCCAAASVQQQPARHFNLSKYQSKQLRKNYAIIIQHSKLASSLIKAEQAVGVEEIVLRTQILAPEGFTVDDDDR